jgi:hypothetical protein
MRIRLDADHLPGGHPSRGDRCDERRELPAHRPRAAAKIDNVITRLDYGRLNCPVTKSPRRGQRVLIAQQGNHLCNRFVVLGRGLKQRWDIAGRLRSCHSGGTRNHFALDLGLDRCAGWQTMRRVPASRRPDTAAIRHPAPSADCPAAAHCVEAFAHHPCRTAIARPTVVASRTSSILGDVPNPPNFEDVGVWAVCVAEVSDAGTTVGCFAGRFGG